MRQSINYLVVAVALTWACPSFGQFLTSGGQDLFVHGINIPWRFYGEDFGGRGRRSYDPAFYDRTFQKISDAGLNTVRMWIHCDGRSYPRRTFDRQVQPLPVEFLSDLESFIDQAAEHDLLVLPVLWTFELADSRQKDLLTNDTILQSYIDQALVPMIRHLSNKCNVLAWEIINEPEWAMDIRFAGTTRTTVSAADMQRFVGKIALAIHENSTHNVTLGSAGLRFSTDAFTWSKNYWHDLAFRNVGIECSGPVLDFYSVHFYDWRLEGLSPFRHRASELGLDKPIFIGEFGLNQQSTKTLLDKAVANGYAGTMPWSMMAGDDEGTWTDYEADLKDFAVGKEPIVKPAIDCIEHVSIGHSCYLYPNPASDRIMLHGRDGLDTRIRVFDWLGRLIDSVTQLANERTFISISDYPIGAYHVQISSRESRGWVRLSSQRLLVLR